MTAIVPFISPYGGYRQVDAILKNVPRWWDTTEGSRFFAVLSAIGLADWALGGDTEPAVVASASYGVGAAGSFSDPQATWDADKFVGMYLEDSTRARFLISSNTSTALVLSTTRTPANGNYRIVRPGSALQEVRADMLLRTATGTDLDVVANNLGVYRPSDGMADSVFRALIPLLSWEPKQTRACVEQVFAALLGDKTDADGGFVWDCFEINNQEIVLEVGSPLLPAGFASYLSQGDTVPGQSANPITSYTVADDEGDKPDDRLPTVAAGPAAAGLLSGTLDAEAFQRLLARYVRAAGVRLTVVFREE